MSEQQSSYRQIMKATSIFGGVQVIQIIVQVIRSKIIAVLLGPAGIGINTLLISSIGLMQSLSNFGLQTSAIKNVAEANGTGDNVRVAVIVTVLRRWVWVTGLLGTLLTIVLSPWLSELTFGNQDYTLAFIWISVSLLFNQISAGQLVLLQGLRKINNLANANLSGAFLGLFVTLPLYYFLDIDGIVPAIIATSIVNVLRSWYFAAEVKIEKVEVTCQTTITEGKQMLVMGFMLSLSGLMTVGGAYLLRIFISNTGGVDQVGLYSAGFALINTYVGLVFTAMVTDYYPRLSAVAADNIEAQRIINQQAEITLLILAPIVSVFMVFIQYGIILLYSNQFVSVNGMVQWTALGMFFRAVSWSIGMIFLAKGASQVYFWNELVANSYLLGFNVIGYKLGGLDGLGISFLAAYFINFFQMFFIARFKYQFSLDRELIKILMIQLLLSTACFLMVNYTVQSLSNIFGSVLITASSGYSVRELDKRLDLNSTWRTIKARLFYKNH